MIIINPKQGLCNRMRAIDSAIAWSKINNRKLFVIWEMNDLCNCKLSKLFTDSQEITYLLEVRNKTFIKFINQFSPVFFSRFNNCYLDQEKIKKIQGDKSEFEKLSLHKTVYIRTFSRFYQIPSLHAFSSFQPRRCLQKIIDSYKVNDFIGVHVRRTDNKQSIMFSPLNEFIDCMKNEVEKNNNVKYFLSTDCPFVEAELRDIFQDKIVSHRKTSLNRNNPHAIKDALVDLYCLANCRKIIRSYYSSFSATATAINKIDSITIKAGLCN